MKSKGAKANRIFSAAACLAAALALAVFSCFAWFANNINAENNMSATVGEGNILDLAVCYYSLSVKSETESAKTFTVGAALEADENGTVIGGYSSDSSSATLIEVTYTVKGKLDTKLIFSGSGDATFPATEVTTTGEDGLELTSYLSCLSNAVSLRLASVTEGVASTSGTAQTFCNADDLSGSGESQTIEKSNVVFSGITTDEYGAEGEDSGYYKITVYLVMEYDDDNVIALYPDGATYSCALNFEGDITLAVKDSDGSDDTTGSGTSGGDSGDSGDSGGETATTYTIAYTATTDTSEKFSSLYTSTDSETTSSVTVNYSALTNSKETEKKTEDGTTYSYAWEIKSGKPVAVTVAEGATDISITIYVSHTSKNSTRNVYVSTAAGTVSDDTIAVVGGDSSPQYIYTLTATLSAGTTYYIWSDDTCHLYGFNITYTI